MLHKLRAIMPELTAATHKGQAGKLLVVGGSPVYTGAPYFAAISALRVGLEWAAVLTVPEAAGPIKGYSPELMVHPTLRRDFSLAEASALISRMDCVVIGNGLGLDEEILGATAKCFSALRSKGLPVVVDGDGVTLVSRQLDLIKNYPRAIITPNAMEFRRLWEAAFKGTAAPHFDLEFDQESKRRLKAAEMTGAEAKESAAAGFVSFELSHPLVRDTAALAKELGVTIVRKGPCDVISDGSVAILTAFPAAYKRCAGQGDVLAGSIAAFYTWASRAKPQGGGTTSAENAISSSVLACFGGCLMTRLAARHAFEVKGRGLLASDMIESLVPVGSKLFPEKPGESIFSGL